MATDNVTIRNGSIVLLFANVYLQNFVGYSTTLSGFFGNDSLIL